MRYQQAELITVKDGKLYSISAAKQATIEKPGSRKGDEYQAYVIEHADIVEDYERDPNMVVMQAEAPRDESKEESK